MRFAHSILIVCRTRLASRVANAHLEQFRHQAGQIAACLSWTSCLRIDRSGILRMLVAAALLILVQCKGSSIHSNGDTLDVEQNEALIVSEFHRLAFVPLERDYYSYSELGGLYAALQSASDGYCEFVHNRKPYSARVAGKLISADYLPRFRRDRFWGSFHNLLSGCWNFYIMNDIRPFDDFKLIQKLFPSESKHCYSVGLMQPYIMHNLLECSHLQFLDVDWRIHFAHYQLENMFREQRFAGRNQTLKAISDLHLGWIAFSPTRPVARHTVDPSTLCRQDQELCLQHLERYQESRRSLKSIVWNLAALHDARFPRHREMPVVYLSNAIEELYTSRAQFDQLMQKMADSIRPEGFALFAYHAAGTDEVGLYTLTRLSNGRSSEASMEPVASDDSLDPDSETLQPSVGYSIETICRDRYHRANTGALKEYSTYFEDVTLTGNPPLCSLLMKKEGIRP